MEDFTNKPENEQEDQPILEGEETNNTNNEPNFVIDDISNSQNNGSEEIEREADIETENETEEFSPMFNPINYSSVEEIKDYKPMSKGLKVFCLIIAGIILLTLGSTAGYLFGKMGTKKPFSNIPSSVTLAETPIDEKQLSAPEVYEKVNKSIVGIVVYNSKGQMSQASGIVFSEKGYIVTNDHIYSEIPQAKFKIYSYDGNEYDGEFVAGDIISDLAVIKIKNAKLQSAQFGNSDELYYGQQVVAIGRPNDATENSSITSGIISGLNRRVKNTSNYSSSLIQTSTAINPGSSGGALVNMYGQIVGVTSSKLASVSHEGVGYAIPTTIMKRIVDELIEEGTIKTRAKLGITYTEINSVTASMNNYKNVGLYIASVSEESGLYGKAEEGDVITHVNGTKIINDNIMLDVIDNSRAGDKITLTVITKGKTVDIEITLSANIGSSSYSTKSNPDSNGNNNGGTFDFPKGE